MPVSHKADGRNVVRADSPHVEGVVIADPIARDDVRMDTRVVAIEDGRARHPAAPGLHRPPSCDTCWPLTRSRIARRSALRRWLHSGRVSKRAMVNRLGIIDRFSAPLRSSLLSLPVNNGFELVEHLRARPAIGAR
jgi:hypothetical protein